MSSCVKCRSRKVRCDRAKPSCGRCLRDNQRCLYTERRKPGPRRGHAQQIHTKVERLEKSLYSLSTQLQAHLSPELVCEGASPLARERRLPDSNALQLTSTAGTPFRQIEEDEQNRLAVSANTPSNQERVSAVASHPRRQAMLATGNTESSVQDGFFETAGLPPYRQLAALVDIYFEHVNAWLPLLEQESILRLLRNPSELDEPDQILLHALVVCGLRYWKDSEATRQKYHKRSKQRIQLYVLEHTNIRGLQALAILSMDAMGSAHTVEALNLLAIIAQNFSQLGLGVEHAFDLGLNIDAPAGLTQGSMLSRPKSWFEVEERSRLFWVVYAIDRYANTCTSSDFKVEEQGVNRPLPCRYDLWMAGRPIETRWYLPDNPFKVTADAPENLGSFSYLCEVTRIMTRIHEFVKRPLDFYSSSAVDHWRASYAELDRQLTSWLNSLPDEYAQISESCRSDSHSNIADWVTVQSGFILAAIRLHSVAGYPPMASDIFKPSHSAMHKCIAAVASMMRTAQDVVSAGMLQFLGPPFAGALWVAGRLLLVHASVLKHELDPSIYFFISTLEKLGEHWPLARAFSSRLRCAIPNIQAGNEAKSLNDLRRVAFQLHILKAEQRYTFSQPCVAKTLSDNELVAFGIFDSFNYPRPSNSCYRVSNSGDVKSNGTCPDVNFTQPDPGSDWINGY